MTGWFLFAFSLSPTVNKIPIWVYHTVSSCKLKNIYTVVWMCHYDVILLNHLSRFVPNRPVYPVREWIQPYSYQIADQVLTRRNSSAVTDPCQNYAAKPEVWTTYLCRSNTSACLPYLLADHRPQKTKRKRK